MRNIGPVSSEWLADVGIHSLEQLRDIGAVAAFSAVCDRRGSTSLNLLWALEGAIRDCDWRALSPSQKDELRRDLDRDAASAGC